MYLKYKRKNGTIDDCVYNDCGRIVKVATGGDFRKGYITFTKEEFEEWFLSGAIEILKNKPREIKKRNTK